MEALDIVIDSGGWDAEMLEPLAGSAVTATLRHMGLEPEDCEVTLLACDDARIADLNAEFRGKRVPTNVLSWPAQPLSPVREGAAPPPPVQGFDGMTELGDIALSHETCIAEATEQGKPLAAHVSHLIVHGVLHLLGYDHITDGDAALMEQIEVEILGNLGLDNPYVAHEMILGTS